MTNDSDSANGRLDDQLARLPREIQPGKDLWAGIEDGIRNGSRRSDEAIPAGGAWWSHGWARAAAAVLLVVASSLTTFALVDRKAPVVVSNEQVWGIDGVGLQFASYPMGPQYLEARRTLSATLESQVDGLEPSTREAVEKSLDEIRQAVGEIDKALRDDPNNVLLQQLLLATYQDELAVLNNLNVMTRNLSVRTDL